MGGGVEFKWNRTFCNTQPIPRHRRSPPSMLTEEERVKVIVWRDGVGGELNRYESSILWFEFFNRSPGQGGMEWIESSQVDRSIY